jgi:hypothetical protein
MKTDFSFWLLFIIGFPHWVPAEESRDHRSDFINNKTFGLSACPGGLAGKLGLAAKTLKFGLPVCGYNSPLINAVMISSWFLSD